MSMEVDLTSVLKGVCPRTFPDVAAFSTPRPYVTYQGIGGKTLRYLDGTPADKRHTVVQINVWADSRAVALETIRAIEDAVCASSAFTARPVAEPISDFDEDTNRYGSRQDFSIYALRG